jgi:hypothetical protein
MFLKIFVRTHLSGKLLASLRPSAAKNSGADKIDNNSSVL